MGDQVRVTTPERQVIGRVQDLSRDSLVIVTGEAEAASTLDLRSLIALEVLKERFRWRGALIGGGVGLGTGVALTGAMLASCSDDCRGGLIVIVSSVYLTPPLILIGAVVGALIPPGRRRRSVPLRDSPGKAFLHEQGPGLALRLQW